MKKPVSVLALGILTLGMVATVACGGEKKEAPPAEAPKVVEEKPAAPASVSSATSATTVSSSTTTVTTEQSAPASPAAAPAAPASPATK